MAKKKIDDLNVLTEYFKDNVLALNLLEKVKFMEETLLKLQDEITKNGVITEMPQGNYSIDRANPALQAYNVTIKNYNTAIKTLNDMLPKNLGGEDEFDKF